MWPLAGLFLTAAGAAQAATAANVAAIPAMTAANVSAGNIPESAGMNPLADPFLLRQQLETQQRDEQIRHRAQQVQIPALRGTAAEQDQPLADNGQRFTLSGISVTPSVFIAKEELKTISQSYVGREIGINDLNKLLTTINHIYEKQGQLTARAMILPQQLQDGVLHILLVEARIDKINWKGRTGRVKDSFYNHRLPVNQGEVLDSPKLMAYIQRFNTTTPGPQVSAGLAPGQEFATTELDIDTYEPSALGWSVFANNYGNQTTGRWQAGTYLSWFSPTGAADVLNTTLIASQGTQYVNLHYGRPLNRYNGVVYLDTGYNRFKITRGELKDLDVKGNSSVYTLGYTQPWWINERWLLTGGVYYSHQASNSTITDVDLSKTIVEDFALLARAEWHRPHWYLRYDQRVRYDSTKNKISADHGSYQIFTGSGYAMRNFDSGISVLMNFSWQMATKPEKLPSGLSYQLGGMGSVRGYDSGILTSPEGAAVSLETSWAINKYWQPFIFYDYGRTMKLGVSDLSIHSTGLGLNFNWKRWLTLSVVAAKPLKVILPEQDKSQFLFQLTLR